MTASPSSSDFSGAEDSASESKSNQSLSVGYYPYEDTFSYEDPYVISREEPASVDSVDSSAHFLPPLQGAWGTQSFQRLLRRRDEIQDAPKQFCKLSIMLAWDVDVESGQTESPADLDLNVHNQWVDKWLEERTELPPYKMDNLLQKLEAFLEHEKNEQRGPHMRLAPAQEDDFQRTLDSPPLTAHISHKEHDTCHHASKCGASENEDIIPVLESPSRPQEDELATQVGQAPGRQRRAREPSSILSVQLEEDASSTSCLNFRGAFRWLRTWIFSRWRREHPAQATVSWHQRAAKKIRSFRSNRIQPQELEHPTSQEI